MTDHLSRALQLLASGQLDEARIYLEELLRQDPENPDLLYNLGLCYVDLGQLDKGRELLHRCLQLAPGHSHACVALALGYQRAGDLLRAREYTMQALGSRSRQSRGPQEPGRHPRQGGRQPAGSLLSAPVIEIDPQDPQTVYGLAFAYMELGDIEPAQKHFQKVLEMEAPEELRVLARDGLRKIAARELKARGPRMDAVFYLLDAMRLFRGKSLQEIQEITFEIGILGKYGLDINDPQESHVLRALPGRTFSALQLICIMYAGFKRIEPGMDIGVDLGEEWGMAERLGEEEEP